MRLCLAILFLAAALIGGTPASAVEPGEVLSDPKLEQRAREISLELRCLVCQNQSIDDSNAPLAKDLRVLVRERLTAGDSDGQVVDYVVARYGEFVLLRPRFGLHTLILWLGTPLLLIIAMAVLYRASRRRRPDNDAAAPKELSKAEKKKLKQLLQDG